MAVTRSPRLGLERWSEGTDPHPNRVQWDAQQGVLDNLVAIDVQVATWADRPMSAARGTYLWVEDEARLYRNTGTGWTTTAKIGGGGAGAQIVVAGTAAEGTSANAARADHTHNLPLATQSAHGGMSKEDKTKLDAATSENVANTLVRRDSQGDFTIGRIVGVATPTAANHLTRKDYVDGRDASTLSEAKGYTDSTDATRKDYVDAAIAAIPDASRTVRGLMVPTDKADLERAGTKQTTETYPAGSIMYKYKNLVRYDGWGRFETEAPESAKQVANKAYVDGRGSTTAQITATTDLNTLNAPGVYNVTRNSLNIPVIGSVRSSCRVEVEVLHASLADNRPTVFQTARMNAENGIINGSWATTFSEANRQALVASQTYRRESYDGGVTWSDWRAEGTTPWFPMDTLTSAGWGSSGAFYGIATGTAYPGVTSVSAGTAVWRICNGMVETPFQVQSPVKTGSELKVADVCTGLRPLNSIGIYRASAETNQYHGIVGAMAVYVPGDNRLSITARGPNTNDSSSVPYTLAGLTWPVPVTSYTP